MSIRLIPSNSTHEIRHKILWPHKNLKDCFLLEDDLKETFHIGGFKNEKLVSVGTFIKMKNEKFIESQQQYRLRAMGTLKEYQGQDFGYKLVKYAITFLKKNKVKLLWCDARINAIPFYEKTGLKTIGDFYSIPKIGRHKLMYIYL